ncbi:MAG: flagellar basal body protein, partial [Pirellula sp.]
MISSLDISTSALVAQRVRLNTISGNIANMSTIK